MSIGGATVDWQEGPLESSSLIEAADRALYLAKGQGRDRMVMSGPVIAPGHDREPALIEPGMAPSLVS